MNLTSFTDYGLRALMRMASAPERSFSTTDLADEFEISRNHLTKVMAKLASAGIVETRRGAGGGARLAKPLDAIRIGQIIRLLEGSQSMVECFRSDGGTCKIAGRCRLQGMLAHAEHVFLQELDRYTLADCALAPFGAQAHG